MSPFSWAKKKLARRNGLANSKAKPLVQDVVLAADLHCVQCQKRVAEMISKVGDMGSVQVNVFEKKVTPTRKPFGRVTAVSGKLSCKA